MQPFPFPRNLIDALESEDGGRRRAWIGSLPGIVKHLEQRWSLKAGEPFQPGGPTAWVAPAHIAAGSDLVLKVAWRHAEAAHEADGLRAWGGDSAARLHATEKFDETIALLVERCVPGTPLSLLPEPSQDTVIVGLLQRLWRPPPPGHGFRPLQIMCD